MTRVPLLAVLVLGLAASALAQDRLAGYLTPVLGDTIDKVAAKAPATRTDAEIAGLLPETNLTQFAEMTRAQRAAAAGTLSGLLGRVDASRLNKALSGPPGTGGTNLVSRVVAPAVLAAGIEYGNILQETSGTVTTLRGNLLGVSRLLFGVEEFPDCTVLAQSACSPRSRHLRAISGTVSFEDTRATVGRAAATPIGTASLLTDDYRVASWGARLDLTPSNNLDDPRYLEQWNAAITVMAKSPESVALVNAAGDLLSEASLQDDGPYTRWRESTRRLLLDAPSAGFRDVLADRLVALIALLEATEPEFAERATALTRAYANYDALRDSLLRAAQTNKLSLEYTNRRPADQPTHSNVRLIYSHQPTASPNAIMTLNAALSFNHQRPADAGRVRDIQFAGQVDRRLGDTGALGRPVLSLAAYYQWMRTDALVLIPQGPTAPGTSIELPAEASTLLGTKGHLGVVQAKLSLRLTDSVKVPLSMTWATRKELIKEKDVRGQVGLTLDIDQILR